MFNGKRIAGWCTQSLRNLLQSISQPDPVIAWHNDDRNTLVVVIAPKKGEPYCYTSEGISEANKGAAPPEREFLGSLGIKLSRAKTTLQIAVQECRSYGDYV